MKDYFTFLSFCEVTSILLSYSDFEPTIRSSYSGNPVPAGILWPTITFSFSPLRLSDFALIDACVSTLVVSWNDAAEMKLLVCKDALVMPCST